MLARNLSPKEKWVLTAMGLLAIILGLLPGPLSLGAYLIACLAFGLLDYKWSIVGIMLAATLVAGEGNDIFSLGPLRYVVPVALVVWLLNYIFLQSDIRVTSAHILSFFFLVLAGISTLVEHTGNYIPHYLALASYVLITLVIFDHCRRETDDMPVIVASLLIGVLIGFTIAYVQAGGFGGVTRRYAVAGSERTLASVAGFVATLLASTWLIGKQKTKTVTEILEPRDIRMVLYSLLCMGVVLITVTRGTILAVLLSLTLVALYVIGRAIFDKVPLRNLAKPIVWCLLLVIGLWFMDAYVTRGWIQGRFGALEQGAAGRMTIWRAGLSSLEGPALFFGNGVSSFRNMTGNIFGDGRDFGAHSIFVDVLVSTGVLGGLLFGALLLAFAFVAIRRGGLVALALWVYVCIEFATAGGLTSVLFWIFLGLLAGLGGSKRTIAPGTSKDSVLQAVNPRFESRNVKSGYG